MAAHGRDMLSMLYSLHTSDADTPQVPYEADSSHGPRAADALHGTRAAGAPAAGVEAGVCVGADVANGPHSLASGACHGAACDSATAQTVTEHSAAVPLAMMDAHDKARALALPLGACTPAALLQWGELALRRRQRGSSEALIEAADVVYASRLPPQVS